jgi:hypothetical protein
VIIGFMASGLLAAGVLPAVGEVFQSGSDPAAGANGGAATTGGNPATSGNATSGAATANPVFTGTGNGAANNFAGGGGGGLVNVPINAGVNPGIGLVAPILSPTSATSGSATSGNASSNSGNGVGGNGGTAAAVGGTTTNAGADRLSNVTGTGTIDRSVIAPQQTTITENTTGTNTGPVFVRDPATGTFVPAGQTTFVPGQTFFPGQTFGTAGTFTRTGQGTVFVPAQSTAQQQANQQQQQGAAGQQQQQQSAAGQQQQQQH